MGRLACIDLPAFPLQLLLRREPTWWERPAVVVAEDKPQARILWVNERARKFEILPGMRYAAGLSLASDLCAGVVDEAEIREGVGLVAERLRRFSPGVEPSRFEAGVFWLDASGLQPLHDSLKRWGMRLRKDLETASFLARVVVGFRRFGTYAVARSRRGKPLHVFRDAATEDKRAREVPLSRLDLDPAARDALRALGIETVEELLCLPAAGLHARFGDEILRLHQLARGDLKPLLVPRREEDSLRQHHLLDDPETNATRLLFLVKRLLDPLLEGLVERRQALAELSLELKLEQGEERVERLRPANSTVDAKQILDLVRLRLESLRLRRGAVELSLDAVGAPASEEQLVLFFERSRRDLKAAGRALARLRAEFGPEAVVRAHLREGHLPEAGFLWTPLVEMTPAAPRRYRERPLVRRMLGRSLLLPPRPRHEEDGWQLRGRGDSPAEAVMGPYVLSGGWWRSERQRDYYYIRTQKGEWLWVYFDPKKRRWFLQGRVE